MSESEFEPLIVVRRNKRQKHGHHGGAWKVAYADFVTAMMAFFLVMWIIGAGTREQKAAIAEYFKNPSMTPGNATVAPPGVNGPGGASDAMIQLGGAMDLSHGPGKDHHNGPTGAASVDEMDKRQGSPRSGAGQSPAEIEKLAREQEQARLEQLMQQLHAAIQNSQALAPFKDQLLLDITPEGLRIQIVDKLNRPMFDLGSAQLKSYTRVILGELAGFINRVPNRITISGHTDDAPYIHAHDYSNWELSTDRANAARRALIAGGLEEDKVARIVGLAASVPMDKAHPSAPVNRRISIIVMNKRAERAALSQDLVSAPPESPLFQAAPAPGTPTANPPAGPGAPTASTVDTPGASTAPVAPAPPGTPAARLPVPPTISVAAPAPRR